ncbi:hypothetical protein TTHERM_00477030 (macronuclear) [Tetrahymena thermophila SB210]|uniref:Uncharacterized protein n=1 Tax=Tetrahymena thermophila (strain SB210) TaxID=312017 RepID=I7MEL9_TETTS|nr:hypothetical protein TTHERM_00477030 [Tetrahymena thermophila SB210]EAR97165.2 hypothetical protein TTHERM_00477030 [Tetrahymena thermophila SB210]|eukprot:XP_001017410.2 hypothetical protein TTHERM_00477030 [Tetrahymena thermophila SB210]
MSYQIFQEIFERLCQFQQNVNSTQASIIQISYFYTLKLSFKSINFCFHQQIYVELFKKFFLVRSIQKIKEQLRIFISKRYYSYQFKLLIFFYCLINDQKRHHSNSKEPSLGLKTQISIILNSLFLDQQQLQQDQQFILKKCVSLQAIIQCFRRGNRSSNRSSNRCSRNNQSFYSVLRQKRCQYSQCSCFCLFQITRSSSWYSLICTYYSFLFLFLIRIRVKDVKFQQFLKLTEDMIVKRELKGSHVKNIAFKLQQIGVYTSSIWKHILEYADQDFDKIDGTTYIEIIYTIYDSKSDTEVEKYIQKNEQKIMKAIRNSSNNVLAFVQGIYLISRIRDIRQSEKEQMHYLIQNRINDIYSVFTSNQLADILYLVYELFNDELKTEQINSFIKKTLDTFIVKDLAEYDTMLQQYEFVDRKNDEIGILDNLKWSSAAKVLTVVSDEVFYDQNLFRRIEDLTMRKSETDIIDIDSASLLLESLILIEITEVQVLLRILEMVDRRLQEEGNKAFEIIHPSSIVRMMTVLNHFLEIDIGLEFCDRLQNYFAGLVKSGDIDYKLTSEYLIELKMAFEDSAITHINKELFQHINELLQKKQIEENQQQ